MALARGTSPAISSSAFQGTGLSQAYTSNTFSPTAGSTVVVVGMATESFNNSWNTPTITDSVGLSWTLASVQSDNSVAANNANSCIALWWANCPSAQTNMTVTQTMSLAGSGQTIVFSSIAPAVWTGASTTAPIGAVVKGIASASPASASVTPTAIGSALLQAASQANAANTASTAGTGCFLVNSTLAGPAFSQVWFGSSGGPTLTSALTATTVSTANAKATPRFGYLAYEVVAGSGAVAAPNPRIRSVWQQSVARSNNF